MSSARISQPFRKASLPAIAVFAKSPVPGRAKTRLIPLLGPRGAAALQAALISDTTAKVNRLSRRASRWLFLAGGDVPDFAGRRQWWLAPQRGHSLANRLEAAFKTLLQYHPSAITIGTDSPLVSPRHMRQALSELAVCDAVIGPCPDGGFYLVGLRGKAPGLFRKVRLGSRHAFQDTVSELARRGLSCAVLPAVADLDRPGDLKEVVKQMTRRRAMRSSARALWRFLKELGARPSRPHAGRMPALPAT